MQPLVDLEQAALALEPVVELLLLAADLPERLGVDERLRRVAGEDLERPLVVLVELVVARLGQDDHAQDARLVGHRDDEHRLRVAPLADLSPARVGGGVAEADRAVVLGDPTRQALADRDPQHVWAVGVPIPANSPWNAIGSHTPAASSTA